MNYDTWLNEQTGEGIVGSRRAIAAWMRIQRDPASIVIVREDGTTLAAQTVRLVSESSSRTQPNNDGMTTSATTNVMLFGIRNHPTLADTDVKRGDQFVSDGRLHRVIDVTPRPGEFQARCEVQQ